MAQDFYGAFGQDSYGTIGNDTTIAQADMEGVSFTMIQALEKRTKAQAEEIELLKKENAALKQQQGEAADKWAQSQAELLTRVNRLEASVEKMDANAKTVAGTK